MDYGEESISQYSQITTKIHARMCPHLKACSTEPMRTCKLMFSLLKHMKMKPILSLQ